ncbi:hypothetical protein NX021_04535 [Cytobacillus firmus]|nr:hypothetical protein [Cytobacillus firmus]
MTLEVKHLKAYKNYRRNGHPFLLEKCAHSKEECFHLFSVYSRFLSTYNHMPEYSIKGQQIPGFTYEFVIVGMILFI